MIIQNTTFVIAESIETDFLHWLRDTYAPAAEASGVYARRGQLLLILAHAEPGTKNFAFQLHAADLDAASAWLNEGEGARLLADVMQRHQGQMAHFSTFMAEIEPVTEP